MTVIGIMSALHEELAAVLADMPDEQRVVVAGREFWVGHWQGHAVVAVLSRIGKVAAATTATVMLERFGVNALVFTGVAGGLGPGVRVGDVVVASGFIQHDMDASPLFPRHGCRCMVGLFLRPMPFCRFNWLKLRSRCCRRLSGIWALRPWPSFN